jgi:hypothetical protein
MVAAGEYSGLLILREVTDLKGKAFEYHQKSPLNF